MSNRDRDGRKFGETGRAIVETLHEFGVVDYRFSKTKHAKVDFQYRGSEVTFHFPCTPRSDSVSVRITRRKLVKLLSCP